MRLDGKAGTVPGSEDRVKVAELTGSILGVLLTHRHKQKEACGAVGDCINPPYDESNPRLERYAWYNDSQTQQ